MQLPRLPPIQGQFHMIPYVKTSPGPSPNLHIDIWGLAWGGYVGRSFCGKMYTFMMFLSSCFCRATSLRHTLDILRRPLGRKPLPGDSDIENTLDSARGNKPLPGDCGHESKSR